MITKIIEATNGEANWGKFLVGRLGEMELSRWSVVDPNDQRRLMRICQWYENSILVLDLQTGEGARFNPPGFAAADLNQQHQIWVCPLFEPFLTWLYAQDLTDLSMLPDHIDLPDAEGSLFGHRRYGAAQTAVVQAIKTAAMDAAAKAAWADETIGATEAWRSAVKKLIDDGILGSDALEE